MGRQAIDMNVRANNICKVLNSLNDNEFINMPELKKELNEKYSMNLSEGQIQGVITYIKDCSRFVDYETYINWFVVSTRSGYALVKKLDAENIGKCYKKLYLSAKAEEQRIQPLLKHLNNLGFDFESLELNDDDFSEFEIERMKEFSDLYNKEEY